MRETGLRGIFILSLLVQVGLIVHVIRTGRNALRIWVILLLQRGQFAEAASTIEKGLNGIFARSPAIAPALRHVRNCGSSCMAPNSRPSITVGRRPGGSIGHGANWPDERLPDYKFVTMQFWPGRSILAENS
jgi:hypothetical protein